MTVELKVKNEYKLTLESGARGAKGWRVLYRENKMSRRPHRAEHSELKEVKGQTARHTEYLEVWDQVRLEGLRPQNNQKPLTSFKPLGF